MIERFIAWIHRITAPSEPVRPTICDLPAEFGERMRLEDVRGALTDPSREEVVNAVVQLMWMHRAAAIEDGRDAALAGEGEKAVCAFGGVNLVDNVMSDVQHLRERGQGWKPREDVRVWFRASVEG